MSKTNNEIIVNNINTFFLNKREIAEQCFKSIRNGDERIFLDFLRNDESSTHILSTEDFDAYFSLVSNVILTANPIECDVLNYYFFNVGASVYWRKTDLCIFSEGDNLSVNAFLFEYKHSYILHLNASDTGSNTPGGSADIVRYISMSDTLSPSAVISFGICYGFDPQGNNDQLGNVIIPVKLYPWSIGQKINEKSGKIVFTIKSDSYSFDFSDRFKKEHIYSQIINFCDSGVRSIDAVFPLKGMDKAEDKVRVFCGSMHTGEAVVSSTKLKKAINAATKMNGSKAILGGEMEGYGLAKECVYYSKIPCIIIKAICDWGAEKNNFDNIYWPADCKIEKAYAKDILQSYAAFCSGAILIKLYEETGEDILKSVFIQKLKRKYHNRKVDGLEDYDFLDLIESVSHKKRCTNRFIFDKLCANGCIRYNTEKSVYYMDMKR